MLRIRLILLLPLVSGCQGTADVPLDTGAVEERLAAYRDAWLRSDKGAVLETLSEQVVLFVPGVSTPVRGRANVETFWFPASDTTYPVHRYDISDQQIEGDGQFAFVTGRSVLGWSTTAGDSALARDSAASTFMTVLRNEAGTWRIYRQMYITD
jgi:ketosteroid isomerase-like protein